REAGEVVVQMLFGQRHVLDRLGRLAAFELDEAVDPEPAHSVPRTGRSGRPRPAAARIAPGDRRWAVPPGPKRWQQFQLLASLASRNLQIIPTVNRSEIFSTFGSSAK